MEIKADSTVMVLYKLPQFIRTESSNEAVISGLGSPLVKQARESTSNDLTKSSGVIRVAPSAKVGGSPRSNPEQRSEAVHLFVSLSYLSVHLVYQGTISQVYQPNPPTVIYQLS